MTMHRLSSRKALWRTRYTKRLLSLHNPVIVRGAVVFACAIVGYLAVVVSHAATVGVSVEAEAGTLTGGATIVNDAGASGGEAVAFGTAGSGSGLGSGSGSGGTTATCSTGGSKLATLQDSFPGTGLNGNNWYLEPIAGEGNTPSGKFGVSGGVLTLSQNTGYTSVNSQKSYDITGSCGFMKLIPDPNSIADQADDGWGIWNSTVVSGIPSFSSGYSIGVQSGKLYVMVVIGDNPAPFSFSATYNPSTMVYARIRESGGRLYFGYSADGKTWTEPSGWSLAWKSSILDVKNCSVQIYAGNLGSKNAGSAGFANFNVAQ